MKNAGLDVFDKGQAADANGPYGYAKGRAEGYLMLVYCIQKQALVLFTAANNPNVSFDQAGKIVKTVYDSF